MFFFIAMYSFAVWYVCNHWYTVLLVSTKGIYRVQLLLYEWYLLLIWTQLWHCFPCVVLAGRMIGTLNLSDVFYYISVVVMHFFLFLSTSEWISMVEGPPQEKVLGPEVLTLKFVGQCGSSGQVTIDFLGVNILGARGLSHSQRRTPWSTLYIVYSTTAVWHIVLSRDEAVLRESVARSAGALHRRYGRLHLSLHTGPRRI